jgi:hypothetical protein
MYVSKARHLSAESGRFVIIGKKSHDSHRDTRKHNENREWDFRIKSGIVFNRSSGSVDRSEGTTLWLPGGIPQSGCLSP